MDVGKLSDSNEFLKVLMGCLKSIVLIVDEQIIINDFNPSFINFFGLDPKDVIGRRCGEVLRCIFTVDEDAECGRTSYCKNY